MKNTLKIIADSIRVSTEKISWNNLKDKPFYEKASYTDTLTWDGTTEGYYNFYDEITESTFVHISDATPTLDDLVSFSIVDNDRNIYLPEDDWQFTQNENLISFSGPTPIFIIPVDNFEIEGTVFTKKGIYVTNFNGTYMTSFTVKDYQFSTIIIKKLDEKFIPNNIAKIEDIPKIKQANWNESNINSKSYIKNRTHYLDYTNGERVPLTDNDIIATWGVINGDGYTTLSVVYDGIEYILEMKCCTDSTALFNHYLWYVGNAYLYNSANIGQLPQDFIDYYGTDDVPFIYALSYHTVGSFTEKCIKFADGSDDHTLELYYIIPKAIPLDEKFIPDSVRTWDSLKNKPFYTEVLYDTIAEEQTVTLTGVSLNLWEGESTGYLQGDFSQLDITTNYKVTFKGETFWATVVQNNDGLKKLKFTSGASIITIDENGYVVIDSKYYNGDYTFKVEKERVVQHTLDENYIPDTIARKSDILIPDTTLTLDEIPAEAKAVGDALLEKTDILDAAYLHSKTDGIYKNVNEIISNAVLNDYLIEVNESINESFPILSHTSIICAFPQINSLNYDTFCFQIKGKYQDELYTFSLNGIPSIFKAKDLMISGKFAATLNGMVKPLSNWDVETGGYVDSEDTFLVVFDMFHNSIQEDFVLEELVESIKNAEFSFYATNKNFLPLNNANEYTPTADYNPATKKYVDDSVALKANISDVKLKDLVVTITTSYDAINKKIVYSCNTPFADMVTAFESGINVLFIFDNPYTEIGYGVYHKNIPVSSTETESRICLVRDLAETTTGGVTHESWIFRADESATYSRRNLVSSSWVTDELDMAITNKADKVEVEALKTQITATSLILADAITGQKYEIQIQNGFLVSLPVEE